MRVYLGIDWSQAKHDACFLNETGGLVTRLTLPHTPTGFAHLDETRQKIGVTADECWVGVETAHNLLIDFLWARDYTHLYIVPPSAVNSTRPRYSQSQAHTDRSDAQVIADLVRTDQQRWSPWHPPSPLIWQLRAKSSLVLYLTQNITRVSNRLRAVLLRYYPSALHTFQTGLPLVAAQLVIHYPTPEAAVRLTWTEFETFARTHGYHRSLQDLRGCYARLQLPQPTATATAVQAYQGEAVLLAELYHQLSQTKLAEVHALNGLFTQHPDASLFTALPGTGEILAPGLLAKFGDDRERFPTPTSLQCLAGTCPVTEASGKRRVVHFRRACDHEFRWLTQEWARCSRSQSTWAATYWEQMRPHCDSDNEAYRRLANRWLAIAWKVWTSRQPYDEAYHLQQHARRSKPRV